MGNSEMQITDFNLSITATYSLHIILSISIILRFYNKKKYFTKTTMSTTSQLIKVELINEKELLDLCEDVKNKISSLKHAVKLLKLMLASITFQQDYISNCKAFLAIHNTIGEAIHSVQNYSIASSRVEGLEVGRWRIRFHPVINWLKFSFATRKKKELDSLLQELETVFNEILSLQNSLLHLGGEQLSTHLQNHHCFNEHSQIPLIGTDNQSKLDYDIIKKKELINSLNQAKEWNLDSFLLMRNLIEWDYRHRFSVGERTDDDDEQGLKEVFVETPLNECSQFYSNGNRIPCKKVTVTSSQRISRTKRLLIFSAFFVCVLLMSFVFVM